MKAYAVVEGELHLFYFPTSLAYMATKHYYGNINEENIE
jgi:hypothetical protein